MSLKEKALKGLGGFLAVMLIFTVLSRAANGMTIPQVETAAAEKKNIEHAVKADGTIRAGGEQAVTTLSGVKIKNVTVDKGQSVAAGDLLAELDMEDLETKIRELEIERDKLALQISDEQYNQSLKDNQKYTAANRASEDYDIAATDEDRKVNNAYEEMTTAYGRWNDARNNPPAEGEEAVDLMALETEYLQKKTAYEDAAALREQTLTEKNRAIEDTNMGNEKNSAAQTNGLDKEAIEIKLTKYQALRDQGGAIRAPIDGIVTSLDQAVVTGGVTPETGLLLLADPSQGYQFQTQISQDDKKFVSVGDAVTLLTKDNEEIKDVTVESITQNTENEEMYDVLVNVGINDKIKLYDSLTMKITNSSKAYETCIPIEALHKGSSGESDYVLVIVEKDSVLGSQKVVEKLEVSVQDSNSSFAALIDGQLTKEQKIVSGSDKVVEAGNRVRLVEKNE